MALFGKKNKTKKETRKRRTSSGGWETYTVEVPDTSSDYGSGSSSGSSCNTDSGTAPSCD